MTNRSTHDGGTDHETNGILPIEATRSYLELVEEVENISVADVYRVTTVIPYSNNPEVKTYRITAQDLDEFFLTYCETWEIVFDIRPEGGDL